MNESLIPSDGESRSLRNVAPASGEETRNLKGKCLPIGEGIRCCGSCHEPIGHVRVARIWQTGESSPVRPLFQDSTFDLGNHARYVRAHRCYSHPDFSSLFQEKPSSRRARKDPTKATGGPDFGQSRHRTLQLGRTHRSRNRFHEECQPSWSLRCREESLGPEQYGTGSILA